MKGEKTKKLVLTALFTALTAVATMLSVPLPHGFANLGDAVVLLAGGILSGPLGALAAGVGSALADVLLGFTLYAPATFVIKGAMAFVLGLIYAKKPHIWKMVVAVVLAECIMLGGYFLYETILYGAAAAALSVFGNAIQGGIGAVVACVILPVVKRLKNIG